VAADGWAATLGASAATLGTLPVLVQGALVVGGLILVAASAVVAERLTFPVLRLLEGYWTRPAPLHRLLVGHRQRRFDRVRARVAPLQQPQRRTFLTIPEHRELRRLRKERALDPERLKDLMERAKPAFHRAGTGPARPGRRVADDDPAGR